MHEHLKTDFKALWSWISLGPKERGHCLRLPTVVTSSELGPTARTMVLRDVVDRCLFFFTDMRSPKVEHIRTHPIGCIHAYDHSDRFQVQIHGHFSLVQDHPKMEDWRSVGLKMFTDYGSSTPPGAILPQDNMVTKDLARKHFMVVQIRPERIELLKLNRTGHWRVRWSRNEQGWTVNELVP